MEATGGHGADVILDIIGAGYLAKNIAALAPDGRIANIGLQQGRRAELDFGALMAKRGTIMSTTLRARPAEQKASIVAAVTANVWPLVDAGVIRPVIDTRAAHGAGRRGAPDHDRVHPYGQDPACAPSNCREPDSV